MELKTVKYQDQMPLQTVSISCNSFKKISISSVILDKEYLIFHKIPTGLMQTACKPHSYLLLSFTHLLQEKDATFTRLKYLRILRF